MSGPGQPADDPASAFASTCPRAADLQSMLALAVLRSRGFETMMLGVADGWERIFRSSGPPHECGGLADRLASIVCDRARKCGRGNRAARSRAIRPRRAPSLGLRGPIRVMRRRPFFARRTATRLEHTRPGPGEWSFPLSPKRRSWGSNPFAGLLPRMGGQRTRAALRHGHFR